MIYSTPDGTTVEARASNDGGWVFKGLAARTEVDYKPWVGSSLTERITRSAFKTIKNDNVVMLIDHEGLPLASTRAGTLTLEVTSAGLEYRAEVAADDPDGVRLMAKIRSGAVWGSSMGFVVNDQEWAKDKRTIKDLSVFDVSAVGIPANPRTSVEAESSTLRDVLEEVRRIAGRLPEDLPKELEETSSSDLYGIVSELVDKALEERAKSVDLLKLQAKRLALAEIVA